MIKAAPTWVRNPQDHQDEHDWIQWFADPKRYRDVTWASDHVRTHWHRSEREPYALRKEPGAVGDWAHDPDAWLPAHES